VQRIHAVLFHQGAAGLGEGSLRAGERLAALPAIAAAQLSPAGQLQVATALGMLEVLEGHLDTIRKRLLDAAAHLVGAKVLRQRLYGAGPVTALALTCWLGGKDRFSSARKAVRFAGLDVTVWSSGRKGPPGRLSRQGPEVLRWCVYEAGRQDPRPILRPRPPLLRAGERPDRRQARCPVRGPQDHPESLPHPVRTRRRRPRRDLTASPVTTP
jgi:transposase